MRAARRRVATALVVVGLALLAGAPAATAQAKIVIESAAEGVWVPGRNAAVVVRVDGPFAGSIEARVGAGMSTNQFDPPELTQVIEVPGGSAKDFVVAVPTPSLAQLSGRSGSGSFSAPSFGGFTPPDTIDLEIFVKDLDGATRGRRVLSLFVPKGLVVGVLPKLAAQARPPATELLEADGTKAELIAISPVLLPGGWRTLDQFSTIAASGSDLSSLDEPSRANLLQWVGHGGHLLVDEEQGPVPGLPDAWQPGPAGWSAAGSGDVRMTAGNLAKNEWASTLLPVDGAGSRSREATTSPVGTPAGDPPSFTYSFGPDRALAPSLARAAGFQVPSMTFLLLSFLSYVVVVGPGLWIVLGFRDRRRLVWVAVPACAVLLSTVFFVAGSGARRGAAGSHATLLEYTAAGGVAYSNVLVGSVAGGRAELTMPARWTSQGSDNPEQSFSFDPLPPSAPPPFVLGAETTAAFDLDPGEFRLVRASGPVERPAPLTVTAVTDGSRVTGRIKNVGTVPIRSIRVLVGTTSAQGDGLAPGQEGEFSLLLSDPELSVDVDPAVLHGDPPEIAGWPPPPSNPRYAYLTSGTTVSPRSQRSAPSSPPDDTPNVVLWADYLEREGVSMRTADQVTVVGWVEDWPAPISVRGYDPVTTGSTAVVVRSNIAVRSGFTNAGVRVETVGRYAGAPGNDPWITDAKIHRVLLPSTVDGQPLDPATVKVRVPAPLVWLRVGGVWERQPGSGSSVEVQLGPEAVDHGAVYLAADTGTTSHAWRVSQG